MARVEVLIPEVGPLYLFGPAPYLDVCSGLRRDGTP